METAKAKATDTVEYGFVTITTSDMESVTFATGQDGSGNDDGYVDDFGYGYGYGNGDGYGDGCGSGMSNGSGYGYGDSDNYSDSYGTGACYGDGYGDGFGHDDTPKA